MIKKVNIDNIHFATANLINLTVKLGKIKG